MDNTIENIVTYSNLLEVTKKVVKEVGYEFQSSLDDNTLEEIVSNGVLSCVKNKVGEKEND